jgi:hypothetical protein
MFLDQESLEAFANLGYLVIVGPILGSGLAITLHSWGVFWRRRTFGDAAVTGWNTFAQVYNMVEAVRYVPKAWGGVGDFFSGDSDKKANVWVLVILAAGAGILTTVLIIRATAKNTARIRGFHYQAQAEGSRL